MSAQEPKIACKSFTQQKTTTNGTYLQHIRVPEALAIVLEHRILLRSLSITIQRRTKWSKQREVERMSVRHDIQIHNCIT